LNHGSDIEDAIKNIRGTSVANLQPNRAEHINVKTLSGISNWFNWRWPKDGNLVGYIQVRELPHIGPWKEISPGKVAKLTKTPTQKPSPVNTLHSIPKVKWVMPQIKNPQNYSLYKIFFIHYIPFTLLNL
jgi:hypothetical protein